MADTPEKAATVIADRDDATTNIIPDLSSNVDDLVDMIDEHRYEDASASIDEIQKGLADLKAWCDEQQPPEKEEPEESDIG
jgi:hypothetical protein